MFRIYKKKLSPILSDSYSKGLSVNIVDDNGEYSASILIRDSRLDESKVNDIVTRLKEIFNLNDNRDNILGISIGDIPVFDAQQIYILNINEILFAFEQFTKNKINSSNFVDSNDEAVDIFSNILKLKELAN